MTARNFYHHFCLGASELLQLAIFLELFFLRYLFESLYTQLVLYLVLFSVSQLGSVSPVIECCMNRIVSFVNFYTFSFLLYFSAPVKFKL